MLKKISTMATAGGILIMVVAAGPGLAAPVQWRVEDGGNGHWYEYVPGHNHWDHALAGAAERSLCGNEGHLATVASQTENDFLFTTFGQTGWLSGSDAAKEGEWHWVAGPEAGDLFWTGGPRGSGGWSPTYANFAMGEPNNLAGQTEHYLQFAFRGLNQWNDVNGFQDPTHYGVEMGYYVEYLPEPATLSLLALGGLALIRRRRK